MRSRYPNSETRFGKLVKFYTKAMLRFLLFGELLEKYCGKEVGGDFEVAPPKIYECFLVL